MYRITSYNVCYTKLLRDAYAHEVLLCIQTGKTMDDPNRMRFSNEEFYVKTPEEMRELFRDYPEALANTVRIAERCNIEFDFSTYHFPHFETEGESLDQILEHEAREGLDQRLADIRKVREVSAEDEQVYRERLDRNNFV